MNQTLIECIRSIRLQTDMSEEIWAEAVNHTSYLVNMSPSTAINLLISKEIWRGESVDYSTLRIFCCPTYSLVDRQKRNKLESKSKSVSSSGSPKSQGFQSLDSEKRSAFTSRDVIFHKESSCKKSQRRRINCKVELQTVRQTLKKRELSSQRALKGLIGRRGLLRFR